MKRRLWLPWLLSLGILISLVLAFICPEVQGERGDAAAADAYRDKMLAMVSAMSRGQAHQQTLSEQEINARFAYLMGRRVETETPAGITLNLEEAQVDLADGRMTLFLTGTLASVPVVFQVRFGDCGPYGPLPRTSIWMGHLPLLGPFEQFMAHRMKPLISPLRKERSVVSQLETCKIEKDQIQLTIAAAE